MDEWVTVSDFIREECVDGGKCGGGLRKTPLVLEPSPRRLLECRLSVRWLNLGGCEASVQNHKELEVYGQLVSLTPTTSVSQAASHEPKGKVIADVQAGEWESSHLSVERQVSVENMKNEVLPAVSSA